jgi:hypothetical protein
MASSLGLATAGALAGALAPNGGELGLAPAPSVAEGISKYALPATAAFAVWGAGLGVAQWVVLRGRIRNAAWWAPATIVGWGLAGATIGTMTGGLGGELTTGGAYDAGGLGVFVSVLISILALGLIPPTSQWLILRPDAPTWGSFSVRFVIGLAIGGASGWVAATALGLTLPSGPAWVIVGGMVGAATGATAARPVLVQSRAPSEGRRRAIDIGRVAWGRGRSGHRQAEPKPTEVHEHRPSA